MADNSSPSQVVGRLIELFAAGRFDQAVELYSDDCTVFLPLLQPGGPLLLGGAAIRAAVLAGGPALPARDIRIRTTEDPEVVIAEWDYVGTNPATGQEVVTGNLLVARVRDGRIAAERVYLDQVTRAFIAGALDTLLAQLKEVAHA
ncbi:nuclear transport factor 2 family protein [Kutzneria sp. NPDC051319]|uniref:nuclear transport factor 2 family protein n=1 Tax=Kutzneria sp. NPDC051319 TaxID=3155047 RepID=UPI003417D34C